MAEAFIRGLLSKQLVPPEGVTVSDPVAERRCHLSQELGIRAMQSNIDAVADAQIIVLAVKPQVLADVLADLAGQVDARSLLITFVAGARINTVRRALGTNSVVRIMPNTPGQVGEGISVWTATPETSKQERAQARELVSALGEEIYVEDERHLDMATALSGSGPAYVFLFIEALIDAGVRIGFSRAVARKLALETVRGSSVFAQRTGLHPATLRNMVTSPGGTTAEALHQLEEGGFRAIISRAVWSAYQKAKSLGRLDDE